MAQRVAGFQGPLHCCPHLPCRLPACALPAHHCPACCPLLQAGTPRGVPPTKGSPKGLWCPFAPGQPAWQHWGWVGTQPGQRRCGLQGSTHTVHKPPSCHNVGGSADPCSGQVRAGARTGTYSPRHCSRTTVCHVPRVSPWPWVSVGLKSPMHPIPGGCSGATQGWGTSGHILAGDGQGETAPCQSLAGGVVSAAPDPCGCSRGC